MWPSDSLNSAQEFSGRAALFPLPNITLFPNVVLPLHIFEPRYRCMVEDVLRTDKYVALALLKDGHEDRYFEKDCPIHTTVCLSRIIADEQLDDGRYYLLTQGLRRARVVHEVESDLPYRVGHLELLHDVYPQVPVIDRSRRQQELIDGFRMVFPKLNIDESLIGALEDSMRLVREELDLSLPLLATGDIGKTEIIRLQRQVAVSRRSPTVSASASSTRVPSTRPTAPRLPVVAASASMRRCPSSPICARSSACRC